MTVSLQTSSVEKEKKKRKKKKKKNVLVGLTELVAGDKSVPDGDDADHQSKTM